MTDAQEAWDDFKKGLRVNKAYPNQVSDSDKLDSILAEQHDIETSIEQLKDDISLMDADDDVDNMSDLEGEEGTEELIMPEDEERPYELRSVRV